MNSVFFNPGMIESRGSLYFLTLFASKGICGELAGSLIQACRAIPLLDRLTQPRAT